MKRKIIFLTGGARRGKSFFAIRKAYRIEGAKAYIAIAEVRDEDLEWLFISRTGSRELLTSTLWLLLLSSAVVFPLSRMIAVAYVILICGSLKLPAMVAVRFAQRRFGGISGYHLGALSEIAEICLLHGVAACFRNST